MNAEIIDFFRSALSSDLFTGGLALAILGGTLKGLWDYVMKPAGKWVQRRFVLEVTTHSGSATFDWFTSWLSHQSYAEKARTLSADDAWTREDGSGVYKYKPTLAPGPGLHIFWYQRRLALLWRTRHTGADAGLAGVREEITLRIWGGNAVMARAILAEAEAFSEGIHRDRLKLYFAEGAEWRLGSTRPKRPAASIVLKAGVFEGILFEVRVFFEDRLRYEALGQPHRKGFLLKGIPGSGKTSVVHGVASELGLAIYVLSLNEKDMSDDRLRALMSRIPPKSLILLEDVDAAFVERKEGEVRVTFKGLLNAIDGISSPEGTVLFMTTNHPEKLDPALVRGGRADHHIDVGLLDEDQARRLYLWFHPTGQDADTFAAEYSGRAPVDARNAALAMTEFTAAS